MSGNRPSEILKSGAEAHETALAHSKQAEKQLADMGIKLGDYRLEPALGGKVALEALLAGRVRFFHIFFQDLRI